MAEVIKEYGRTLLVVVVILAVVFLCKNISYTSKDGRKITGMRNILGWKATICEEEVVTNDRFALEDYVSQKLPSVVYNKGWLSKETAYEMKDLFIVTQEANVVVDCVRDEEGKDMLRTGDVIYDKSENQITFLKKGIYDMTITVQGNKSIQKTFVVCVGKSRGSK